MKKIRRKEREEEEEKKKKAISPRPSRSERRATASGRVVLLQRLPEALVEDKLRRFVSQFGRVTRVYQPLARSSLRTRKGLAFVELATPEAARAVASTLNNYLLFHRLLKARVLPSEGEGAAKEGTFRRRAKPSEPRADILRRQEARREKTEESKEEKELRKVKRKEKLQKKLSALKELCPDYAFQEGTS